MHKYRRTPKIGERLGSALLEFVQPHPNPNGVRPQRPLGFERDCYPKNKPLHICYHVKFGTYVSNDVRINKRELQKLGSAWVPSRCGGGVADPLDIRPSTRVILPNLVVLGQII